MYRFPSGFRTPEGEAEYIDAYNATLALWPVPFDSQEVNTRCGLTHIIVSGPTGAPPLFLLHGMNTSATMWFPNVAELAHRYRVYAVDTIGSASRSVASRPLKNRAEFADWLDDVCHELGIACTHMVGHSHGAWIALNYALSAPERVKRLILLAPAGALVPLATQFYVRGIPTLLFPVRPLITSFMRWMTAEGFVAKEPFVEQFLLGAKHFRSQIRILPSVFSDAELRQITTPTLLLLGAQEVLYDPRAASNRARRLIPNIKVEIIPNSSHGLPMEQPRLVNEHVLSFLGPVGDWPLQAA